MVMVLCCAFKQLGTRQLVWWGVVCDSCVRGGYSKSEVWSTLPAEARALERMDSGSFAGGFVECVWRYAVGVLCGCGAMWLLCYVRVVLCCAIQAAWDKTAGVWGVV